MEFDWEIAEHAFCPMDQGQADDFFDSLLPWLAEPSDAEPAATATAMPSGGQGDAGSSMRIDDSEATLGDLLALLPPSPAAADGHEAGGGGAIQGVASGVGDAFAALASQGTTAAVTNSGSTNARDVFGAPPKFADIPLNQVPGSQYLLQLQQLQSEGLPQGSRPLPSDSGVSQRHQQEHPNAASGQLNVNEMLALNASRQTAAVHVNPFGAKRRSDAPSSSSEGAATSSLGGGAINGILGRRSCTASEPLKAASGRCNRDWMVALRGQEIGSQW